MIDGLGSYPAVVYAALIRPASPVSIGDGAIVHLGIAHYRRTADETLLYPTEAVGVAEVGKTGYLKVTPGLYLVHVAAGYQAAGIHRLAIDAYCETTNLWDAEYGYDTTAANAWINNSAVLTFAEDADNPSIDLIAWQPTGAGAAVLASWTLTIVYLAPGPAITVIPV